MPLDKSGNNSSIGNNVRTLKSEKYPQRQAIAIALDIARRAKRASGGRMAYADGGSSNRNMSRAISERAMRGLDPTPEQQEYLAEMQRLRDQRGEENLAALRGLVSDDLPMPDAKIARRVSDRAMRGRDDFTYQEMQHLADTKPGKERRGQTLGTAGAIGAEITGIPAILRGTGNIAQGVEEGDWVRGLGGAAETAIGAIPGLSVVRGPVGAAAKEVFKTTPRTAGVLGTTGFLNSYPDEARAAEKNQTTFIQNDPAVKALIERRRAAQEAMQKAETDIIMNNAAVRALQDRKAAKERELAQTNARHARSGVETQRQALDPIKSEIARINEQIEGVSSRARQPFLDEISRINEALTGAEADAQKQFKDQASFRDKYPGAPMAIMGAGLGIAGGMPLAKESLNRLADRMWRGPELRNATEAAKKAFASGASDAETATAQTLLRDKLHAWDKSHGPINTAGALVGNTMKGALYGAEASQLPEQIDYISNPPGHPARERASELFRNPDYWKDRLGPAILGAGVGLTGTSIGKMVPQNKEFLSEAREVASRGKEPTVFEKLVGRLTGKTAEGPTEAALADVRRYREAIGPQAPDAADLRTQVGLNNEALLGIRPGTAAPSPAPTAVPMSLPEIQLGSGAPFAKPGAMPRLTERMRAQDQVLGPVETPSQPAASAAPEVKLVPVPYRVSPSGRKNYAKGTPEELGVRPGGFVKAEHLPPKQKVTRKKAASKPSKKTESPQEDDVVPSKPDMPIGGDFGPFARGGVVGAALRIARNMGGRAVLTGPVTHKADGGRTDTVQTSLPSHSYVIPADIVSSLGEGDTNAGYNVLQSMFGTHETSGDTGEVPAIVAGGEYILSPEQVMQIGGGDPEMAFKALDQWVKMQRRNHIQTLKGLPPPVKD